MPADAVRTFQRPAIALYKGRTDYWTIADNLTDFADFIAPVGRSRSAGDMGGGWTDGKTFRQAVELCRTGDLSRVAMSDNLMTKLEDQVHPRLKYSWINAVTGGAVDMGRYLGGDPLNMKQRRRVPMEQAPLNIVADLGISGSISAAYVAKRGAAILALVRMLSDLRPVALWAFNGGDANQGRDASYALIKLETQPLDLARVAYVLQSAAFTRQLCFAVDDTHKWAGKWPYDSKGGYRKHAHAILRTVLPDDDILYIPGSFSADGEARGELTDIVNRPELWLKAMLASYGAGADDEEGHSYQAA